MPFSIRSPGRAPPARRSNNPKSGALRVGLPASLAGSDGQIVLKFAPPTTICDPGAWVSEDANGDGVSDEVWYGSIIPRIKSIGGVQTVERLSSDGSFEISACEAAQAQYRIGSGAWTDIGLPYTSKASLCQTISEAPPPALASANLPDVRFRIVRYSASVALPNLEAIALGQKRTYTLSYAPAPNATPSSNVSLGVLLELGSGARFSPSGTQTLFVQGPGSANFEIEGTASGAKTLSARLATRATPSAPVTASAHVCQTRPLNVIDIGPDSGMTGAVGDMIASNRGASGEKHFVSPKKSAEIPSDYVILKAQGIDAATFQQVLEWQGGEAVPNEPLKRRVKRDAAAKTAVTIKGKQSAVVAARLNVWVVWWTVTAQKDSGPTVYYLNNAGSVAIDTQWSFEATVSPAGIVDLSMDVPDMTGNAGNPRVPRAGEPHFFDGNPIDDATFKWDITRQWRERDLLPKRAARRSQLAPFGRDVQHSPQRRHHPGNFADPRSRSLFGGPGRGK